MIRTLDIFCGAGGSSAGAQAAGTEIVAAIDRCSVATATYKANFPAAKVVTSRLEDVGFPDFKRQAGKIDLLLASPECRNHTCARGAAPRDEASRATALMTVEYARTFKPRWLVLENVVHMRPWSRYDELKSSLEDVGYYLEEHVLVASDFGVPQARRRLFLVGDLTRPPRLKFGGITGERPSISILPRRTGNVEDLTPVQSQTGEADSRPGETSFQGPRQTGQLSGRLLRQRRKRGVAVSRPSATHDHDARPLRTRRTRWSQVDDPDAASAGTQARHGLGDDFKLPVGTRRDRIKLLGNGVCPPVMKAVVRSLVSAA